MAEGTMIQIGAPLVGSYDDRLVALSIFIAISASYSALDLAGRITAARGWIRLGWLVGGATALGIGIWSMHFTGMLAFILPVPAVVYHWPTVFLSLIAAILASAVVLFVATRKKMGPVRALAGSVTMGAGIAGMHFIGMAAMRLPAVCHFRLSIVCLAVVVGVLASLVALVLTFDFREETRGTTWAKLISAAGMGIAISAMHYTGMASASFTSSAVPTDLPHTVSISSLGIAGIVLATLIFQAATIVTSSVDRRLAAQALEVETSERFRQIADNLQIVLALSPADFSTHLYVNRTYEKIWGHTVESLYANPHSWLEAIHPEDRGRVSDFLQRLTRGEAVDDLEYRIVRPDGSTRWIAARGYPIFDAQGRVYRIVSSASDVTERKRAEEQLRREQSLLAMAQRMARMGVWSWNPSSSDMFGSEEFYRIFGINPDKTRLTREIFLECIHPEDRSRYESEIHAAVAERRNWELDYRIVLPDASFKYVHAIGTPVFNKSGDILEFVGTTLDITERKRAEQELRQAQERIRAILENSPNLIFLKDTEGQYLLVNREFERALRVSQEQIKGKTDEEVFPPEQVAVFRANDLKVLRAGVAMEFEEIAIQVDGPHTSIVHKFPLFDAHGNIYATGGVATDITQRKRAEEARRQSEEQYRTVVETATDAVISIDEVSQILFVNPATTRIFGYDSSELIGRSLTILMPEFMRELHKVAIERYLATGQRHMNWQGVELIGLRKNGEEFPVEVSFGEIVREGCHIFTGFIRNITDRKRAEEALRLSEREQRQTVTQLERERARLVEAQEVAKMGSWEAELQTLNVSWSEQTHRIFETDPSCFHPTRPKFREFIHAEDRARVDAAFVASLDKLSPCTVEYRIVMPDGRIKILEERWQAFHDEEGKPVRVAGTCRDITERVRAEEELQRLSGRLLRFQDEERRKIARDLHDSTGQDLVALATMLGQLRDSVPSSQRKPRRLLAECKALADQCIREVRTLSYLLHPPVLDQAGLGDAILDYVKGFSKRSGIQVELDLSPRLGRMERNVELALFRVVQESLTNIQRHSGSQRAKIRIDRNSDLTLEISDHGLGAPATVQGGKEESRFELGVGIPSMEERVKLIGGRFEIHSTNHGTTVRVTIPLERNEREKAAHSAG
jgi:PAS domain S-box-containing protein